MAPLTLNVYLPEKQYDSLKVSNSNGFVSIKKLNTTYLNANTNNGRVELKEINSPKIIAETNNGIMGFKDIIAQNIHVKSNNGRIMLEHIEGEIEGQSKNGSLTLKTNELDRNLNFTTHNGKSILKPKKNQQMFNLMFLSTMAARISWINITEIRLLEREKM